MSAVSDPSNLHNPSHARSVSLALSRRQFLNIAGATTASTLMAAPLENLFIRAAKGQSTQGDGYGPLIPDPRRVLDLPQGFQYQAFSRTGETMSDGNWVPAAHDGMAAFAGPDNTTILVRNHELSPHQFPEVVGPKYDPRCTGGTTTLIIGPDRQLQRHYASLAGTYRNCAGGPTPWGSWISCEENTSTPDQDPAVRRRHGYNFEVPSRLLTPVPPEPLVAMGRFNHEAIAVDPNTGIVYQTEDRTDGLFYRFIPYQPGRLQAGGILEALKIKNQPQAITRRGIPMGQAMAVEWVPIDDPDPPADTVREEGFAKGAAQFSRGEGITFGNNELYFCCTSGGQASLGQVWRYVPGEDAEAGGVLTLFVESEDYDVLEMPDNITVAPFGDLFVCEDGWGFTDQYIRGISTEGRVYPFARNGINNYEFAGICFAIEPLTLFVNIQTPGITFAIWGPFSTI